MAEPRAPHAAVREGYQPLNSLKALVERVGPRVEEGEYAPHAVGLEQYQEREGDAADEASRYQRIAPADALDVHTHRYSEDEYRRAEVGLREQRQRGKDYQCQHAREGLQRVPVAVARQQLRYMQREREREQFSGLQRHAEPRKPYPAARASRRVSDSRNQRQPRHQPHHDV